MNQRRTFHPPDAGGPVIVILCAPPEPRVEGKFVMGRTSRESAEWVLAFDAYCALHRDIGVKYGIRPAGGGWCRIDHEHKEIWIGGRSTQFGSEPDRNLTLRLLRDAFTGYFVERDD